MKKRNILIWELFGIIFILLFGGLFHFIYELSGYSKIIAIFGAVNESTWEHIKIGFWPAFIFGLIEYIAFGRKIKTFIFAKSISFILIIILIPAIFYLYIFIAGENYLLFDILIFIISVIVAQIFSYRLIVMERYHISIQIIGIILLLCQLLAFSIFTSYPPRNELFRDPIYKEFGIIE